MFPVSPCRVTSLILQRGAAGSVPQDACYSLASFVHVLCIGDSMEQFTFAGFNTLPLPSLRPHLPPISVRMYNATVPTDLGKLWSTLVGRTEHWDSLATEAQLSPPAYCACWCGNCVQCSRFRGIGGLNETALGFLLVLWGRYSRLSVDVFGDFPPYPVAHET